MSAQEIRHDVMRIRPDLVGLDIVHEIPYEDEKDLRRIAQTLTQTAREAGCHVLAAVHLNDARSVGHYPPAPALRDIKGASAIRQGADNVLLLHRFEEEQEGRGTGDPGEDAEIHVAKVRNGILGKQRLRFEGRLMRFELPFDAATVGIAA
jgi:replicative DNA helicase